MASFNVRKSNAETDLDAKFPDARYTVFASSDSNELRFKCLEAECNGYEIAGKGNFERHLEALRHQKIFNRRSGAAKGGKAVQVANAVKGSNAVKSGKDPRMAKKTNNAALLKHYTDVIEAGTPQLELDEGLAVLNLLKGDAAAALKTDDNGIDVEKVESSREDVDLEFQVDKFSMETVRAVYTIVCRSVPGVLDQYPKP